MRHLPAALGIAILLALTGCADDPASDSTGSTGNGTRADGASQDQPPTGTTAPDPEAELSRAVMAYSDAYLGGDGAAARALLSARCQARLSQADMDAATSLAASMYGAQIITSVEVTVSGDMARATYTYPDSALDQTSEPWVHEDGEWRQDDC